MTVRQFLPMMLLAAGMVGVAPAVPASAGDDQLAIEPSSGKTDWGNIMLISTDQCPSEASAVVVRIEGASFPTGSNAVGNTTLSSLNTAGEGGIVIPLFGSWDVVAQANNATGSLEGDAHLILDCVDQLATQSFAQMSGDVHFERSDSGGVSYAQVGGPTLTSGTSTPDDSANPSTDQAPGATDVGDTGTVITADSGGTADTAPPAAVAQETSAVPGIDGTVGLTSGPDEAASPETSRIEAVTQADGTARHAGRPLGSVVLACVLAAAIVAGAVSLGRASRSARGSPPT